jgi:hypothetical protein
MGRISRDATWHTLGGHHSVGRADSCALRVDDPRVSRLHAEFRWRGSSWELHDLGSANKTYVDGKPLERGGRIDLRPGALLGFASVDAPWTFDDDTPPVPCAVRVAGCAAVEAKDELIALPDSTAPSHLIYRVGTGWALDTSDGAAPVEHGHRLRVDGVDWRFQEPSADSTLDAPASAVQRPAAALSFRVSPDEEHVELRVGFGGTWKNLGARSCFYLGLTLARLRLADRSSGAAEHGWVPLEELLTMLPDYASLAHLNVDVFRLRQHVARLGFDGGSIIERRRGAIRLGADAIEIEVIHD